MYIATIAMCVGYLAAVYLCTYRALMVNLLIQLLYTTMILIKLVAINV